jgi:hypothetical protein
VVNLSPVVEETEGDGRPDAIDDSSSEATSSSEDASEGGDGDGETGVDPWWCESTNECPEGRFCWADYQDGNGDAPLVEDFACHLECVPDDDPDSMTDSAENYWCLDDASCCSPNAACGAMGYCSPS